MKQRHTYGFLLYSVIFHIGLLGLLDVLVNFYFASLGHNPETIGLLQALPRLGGFLISVPVGLLTNRVGTKRMLIVASVVCAVSLWMQLIPILPMLALSRFLYGMGYGAQQIANAPFMVDLVEQEDRTRFFALHNFVTMVAMAFGSFIGGFMPNWIVSATETLTRAEWVFSPTSTYAYGVAIFIAGWVGVISVLPLFKRTVSPSHPTSFAQPVTPSATPVRAIPWQFLGLAALPMLAFGFSGGMSFPFYNLFWREQFTLPDQTVGTILSIGWIGMATVPLINGRLEHLFGRSRAILIAMVISAVTFFMLGLLPPLVPSLIIFVVALSFRNVMNPLFQPLMLESVPSQLANIVSSMGLVMWNVGWFVATAMGGFIAQALGYGVVMMLVAVSVLLTGVAVAVIFNKRLGNFQQMLLEEPS